MPAKGVKKNQGLIIWRSASSAWRRARSNDSLSTAPCPGLVFLIVAGYTEKQIAPVIGLLGTIAGYLLGKSSSETGVIEIEELSERLQILESDIEKRETEVKQED